MKFLLPCFLFLVPFIYGSSLQASHVSGADITYTCLGQDTFLVSMSLYRDCSGAAAPGSVNLYFDSPCSSFSQTWQLDTTLEVSQLCPSALGNSTCSGGNLPGMQQLVYEHVVVLSPCNQGPWTISWTSCCRNSSGNLQGQDSFWIGAQLDNGQISCNSSPQFTSQPIPYICKNQPVTYNLGVIERDGDSLVYELAQPLAINSTDTVPYAAGSGYSYINPLNVPVSLNAQTGDLTFTPSSLTPPGSWVLKICVKEYRNGILIGEVCRDMQFVLENCNNFLPYLVSPGIQGFSGTGLQLDSNSIEVCVGNTFSFFLEFADSLQPGDSTSIPPIFPQIFGDSVTLTSNIQQVLPGANVSIVNGNPASLSVSWTAVPGTGAFSTLVVNATDDACNVTGIAHAAFDVTVIPATNAGPDQRLCRGEDTAFVTVAGGTEFEWAVISGDPIQLGVNFRDTTGIGGKNVWMLPNNPTTYQVVSNLSGNCINTDTITIIPSRNFLLNTIGDTAVCPNDPLSSFVLSALPDTGTSTTPFNLSYRWSNGSLLDFDTIQSPTATVTGTQTFQVTVASDSGCVKEGGVTITFAPSFPDSLNILFTDTALCAGDSTQALVFFGVPFSNSCGLATAPCGNNTSEEIVGTGTQSNAANGWPTVYSNSLWYSSRTQFMYTAAEMQALGMVGGGKINSISFFVNQTNGIQPLTNFTIKVGCTSDTNFTMNWATGTTTVFGPVTYTVTQGWNVHNFTTPYDWDGTSSLVVEICYHNNTSSSNASVNYTTTPFQSVMYYRDFINSSICTFPGISGVSSDRPNTRFNFCAPYDPAAFTYQWSPNTQVSNATQYAPHVTITNQTTFFVTVSDTFGACHDSTSRSLTTTTYDPSFQFNGPYCVYDDPDTAHSVVTPGGIWTGSGIIDSIHGVFDPGAAGIGSHPVTYAVTSPAGNCPSDTILSLTVLGIPDATISAPDEVCRTAGPYQFTAATPGGIWTGLGITDPVLGTYDPIQTPAPGTFTLTYSITTPCLGSDTVQLLNYAPYRFDYIDTPRVTCEFDTIQLENNVVVATGPIYSAATPVFTWSGPGIGNSADATFDPNLLTVPVVNSRYETISLTLSDSNSECETSDDMRILVNNTDTIAITSPLTYCDNDNQTYSIGITPNSSSVSIMPLGGAHAINITSFIPALVGSGSWLVQSNLVNSDGCEFTRVDTLRIAKAGASAAFTYSDSGLAYTFQATLNPGSTYTWDFGDGNTGQGATVQHTYANVGSYTITLSVTNLCGTQTTQQTVSVVSGIARNDLDQVELVVYPNPSNGSFYVMNQGSLKTSAGWTLFDNTGRLVSSGSLRMEAGEEELLPVDLPRGLYHALFEVNGEIQSVKLIVY